jgi:hypothetical protein
LAEIYKPKRCKVLRPRPWLKLAVGARENAPWSIDRKSPPAAVVFARHAALEISTAYLPSPLVFV